MKRAKEHIFTQEARLTYWQTRQHICGICGKPIMCFSDMHLDHVIPVSRGGSTSPENIQLTHAACNLRKGDKITGSEAPCKPQEARVEGFANPNGWFPLCYSEQVGWYGLAVASMRGAIGLMRDAGRYDDMMAQLRKFNEYGFAWTVFAGWAKRFAARYFDHEVSIEKVFSIYRKKITPHFFDAIVYIEHNCGVQYLESSPHRVQFYDVDSDRR